MEHKQIVIIGARISGLEHGLEGSFDKNGPNADTPASYVGINSHDVTSENKEDEGAVKITSPSPLNSRSMVGTKRDISSSIKIVKVNTLINEEKVLGAHVALPLATVNEICAKFDNTLYGYFIGSWLAFPIVRNYVCNAWAKYEYGFESLLFRYRWFFFLHVLNFHAFVNAPSLKP
ncbi:hypothetical protein Tco_0365424 [Tanacetum coccineum]